MNLTDETLVRRTLAGDVDAYGVLVERHCNATRGLKGRQAGDLSGVNPE